MISSNISAQDVHQLYSLYVRANELAVRAIPSHLLHGLRLAHNTVQWHTTETDEKQAFPDFHSKRNIWAASAASLNYISASHVDDDFFPSGLYVLCHDDTDVTTTHMGHTTYRPDLPTSVHFCLPKKGVAIALKPGDFIIFNPVEPHCVSMREKFYEHKQVFLMSFYLKSAVVGLHDNSLSNDIFADCESLHSYFKQTNDDTFL
jgi:hypothetical protein